MTAVQPAETDAAAGAIRRLWPTRPKLGIIAGSGLGELTRAIDLEAVLDYESIPHFPPTTAPGHGSSWICGRLGGVAAVALDGRFHGYEGHRASQVAFPVRVMAALGAEMLIVACAVGGMNPTYRSGDVMVIDDHVNLSWDQPLLGTRDANALDECPARTQFYDPQLIALAMAVARKHAIVAHRGTYVGVLGPNYETRAEYRFLARVGDAVGMSTVPEVTVAARGGMRVLGLAVITNVCAADRLERAEASRVIAAAQAAAVNVRTIIEQVVAHERADGA